MSASLFKKLNTRTKKIMCGYCRNEYEYKYKYAQKIPFMINLLFGLYYQQQDTFQEAQGFRLIENSSGAVRTPDKNEQPNRWASIFGKQLITAHLDTTLNKIYNNVTYTWKLKINRHAGGEFVVGIINEEANTQTHCKDAYGIDNSGDGLWGNKDKFDMYGHICPTFCRLSPAFGEDPLLYSKQTSTEEEEEEDAYRPLYYNNDTTAFYHNNDELKLQFEYNETSKQSTLSFWSNGEFKLHYPKIKLYHKYRLVISLQDRGTNVQIIDYECSISNKK